MDKERSEVTGALLLILQIGINMLVPIFAMTFLGILIGDKIGVNWISVIGFIIGSLAGFTSVYKIIKRYLRDENTKKT